MLATEPRLALEEEKFTLEPSTKKLRTDSSSTTDSNLSVESAVVRTLELEGVKELFQDYDLLDTEAVKCVICGKSYKSKVCVKKHLWEHSVYWDLFDGLKKQQRVLSIQAAIILAIKFNPSLSLLLVTNSSSGQKKKEKQNHTNLSSPTTPLNNVNTIPNPPKQHNYHHTSVIKSPENSTTSTTRVLPESTIATSTSFNRKRKLDHSSELVDNKPTEHFLMSRPTTLYKLDKINSCDNFAF